MDPKRRQDLLERRRLLQEKMRQQRQHEAYYYDVRWQASQLEQLGVAFEFVHDLDPLHDWLHANFPFSDEEIFTWGLEYRRLPWFRFSRREDGEILTRRTPGAVVQRWLRAVKNQERLEDGRVTAFYGRYTPSLELSFDDAFRHAEILSSRDGWLIPASRSWVLQCTNSELLWARPAPELVEPPV